MELINLLPGNDIIYFKGRYTSYKIVDVLKAFIKEVTKSNFLEKIEELSNNFESENDDGQSIIEIKYFDDLIVVGALADDGDGMLNAIVLRNKEVKN